jgi:hypothetical protein
MTDKIFKDFFLYFNREINGRKAVLLINGFKTHQTEIDFLQAKDITQPNLTIRFFLSNATSLCQPLDQGIIRKRWLKFAVQHFEKNEDPAKHLDILQALRWSITAWIEITPVTISNCWLKSRVFAPKYGPQTRQEAERDKHQNETLAQKDARYNTTVSQISIVIQALAELGRIQEAMPTESFVNPEAEIVDDAEEDIFEQIAQAHADGDCEPESSDEAFQMASVSLSEALAGLATLRLYEEQQEDGSRDLIRSLNRLERELLGKQANQATQTQIDSYFRS